MRIVACIKQVPAQADIRIDEQRWTLVRQGVPNRINPHDAEGLETALMLRDHYGGEVLVISMGPPQSEEALREALAMGADCAILVTDRSLAGADTLVTSLVLARAIERLQWRPDLILCGARSSDSDTGQVGPQLAEELGIPHVAYVQEVTKEEEALVVRRSLDRYWETIRVRLPALLTVSRAPGPVREISLRSIHQAFKEGAMERWGIAELGLDPRLVGHSGSATTVRRIFRPEGHTRTKWVRGGPQEAANEILQALVDRHILD